MHPIFAASLSTHACVRRAVVGAILSSATFITACAVLPGAAPSTKAQGITVATIAQQTDAIFDQLVAIRRDLYQHPELGGKELRTAAQIEKRLRALGLEVQTAKNSGGYGHSVVGILRGALPGKTVAWRADMDAIPGVSVVDLSFRSQNAGVHHHCGHDLHMTIALGMAEVLAKQRASLRGTVMFIFQPEEESFTGAKGMVDRGLFAKLRPDEIYALHVTPFAAGEIWVKPREMYAHQRRVQISLDASVTQSQIAALNQRLSAALTRAKQDAEPWIPMHMFDPTKGLTAEHSAFADYAFIAGQFEGRIEQGQWQLEADTYETQAEKEASLIARIRQAVESAGHASALRGIRYVQANPTVVNDTPLTAAASDLLNQQFGAGTVRQLKGQVPYSNDDFAYFQQQVPGVYFFFGASNPAKGQFAMVHAPSFHADEESLRLGVSRFAVLLAARLGSLVMPR
jgi:metal-dependent amidase/aminoacylase/carboxypeptidase family protein